MEQKKRIGPSWLWHEILLWQAILLFVAWLFFLLVLLDPLVSWARWLLWLFFHPADLVA